MYLTNVLKYYLGFNLPEKEKVECGDYVIYSLAISMGDVYSIERIDAVNYKKDSFYTKNYHFTKYMKLSDLYWNKFSQRWESRPWIRTNKEELKRNTRGKNWRTC